MALVARDFFQVIQYLQLWKKENVILSNMASTGPAEVKTEPVINKSAVSATGKTDIDES